MPDLIYRARPTWDRPSTPESERQRFPFMRNAGNFRREPMPLPETLDLLDREAAFLGADEIVIEVVGPSTLVRASGRLRADARLDHPGVGVYLDTRHGDLRYATDWCFRWQDNVRAVALALEALRKVDRYGVTGSGEQYRGFTALPPGGTAIAMGAAMTVEDAARLICTLDGHSVDDFEPLIRDSHLRRSVFRSLAKRLHPDVGGDRATWDRLEEARRVLGD